MKYTPSFFRDQLPTWKRKIDPLCVKYFYRPVSYSFSAFCANHNIKANVVTVISFIPAVLAGILFATDNHAITIIAACMISIWLLFDAVDGNLARCVNRQPFGDFLDALGSYLLSAFLGIGLGINVYLNGGFVFTRESYISIIIGGLASIFDMLMRLTHQNYKNSVNELEQKGIIKEKNNGEYNPSNGGFVTKVKMEFGIAGIVPPLALLFSIIGKMDILLIYLFLYNCSSCISIVFIYVKKALSMRNTSL